MFETIMEVIAVLSVSALVCLVVWVPTYIAIQKKRERRAQSMVLCFCENNGIVGVVRRVDLNQTSNKLWKRQGHLQNFQKEPWDEAVRLDVFPVFHFHSGALELQTLMGRYPAERAEFEVNRPKLDCSIWDGSDAESFLDVLGHIDRGMSKKQIDQALTAVGR